VNFFFFFSLLRLLWVLMVCSAYGASQRAAVLQSDRLLLHFVFV
jgi:hypothetical protein